MDSKEEKYQWFLEALLALKGLKNLNQSEIAEDLGISRSMISGMKSGKFPIPDSIIDKMVKTYSINPPNPYGANNAGDTIRDFKQINQLLITNMADLRRELLEVYDHITTLKEFNQSLRDQAPHSA